MARRILFAILMLFANATFAQSKLRIFNYPDYIEPSVLKAFEQQYKVTIEYVEYGSSDEAQVSLLKGNSGFDVAIVASRPHAAELIKAKMLARVSLMALPNLAMVEISILQSLEDIDYSNRYLVPYLWGTTGLGYNESSVFKALGAKAPIDSWALLFNPANAAKLAACGISVIDDAPEAIAAALMYLGKDPNSVQIADLSAVEALFKAIRPHIKQFSSDEYMEPLADGKLCLAVGYSGDILQARALAVKNQRKIAYSIPTEGAIRWQDVMLVPADSKQQALAFTFVNFMLQSKVMAQLSNTIGYANPIENSLRYIDKTVRNDPGIYPKGNKLLKEIKTLNPENQALRLALWERIKKP